MVMVPNGYPWMPTEVEPKIVASETGWVVLPRGVDPPLTKSVEQLS